MSDSDWIDLIFFIQGNDVRTPKHLAIANQLETCKHLFQNRDALMFQFIVQTAEGSVEAFLCDGCNRAVLHGCIMFLQHQYAEDTCSFLR